MTCPQTAIQRQRWRSALTEGVGARPGEHRDSDHMRPASGQPGAPSAEKGCGCRSATWARRSAGTRRTPETRRRACRRTVCACWGRRACAWGRPRWIHWRTLKCLHWTSCSRVSWEVSSVPPAHCPVAHTFHVTTTGAYMAGYVIAVCQQPASS